jgi:NAD(P)-dependent dehydrogenase (short-subunit alcohol dehydrogenase family)
MPEKQTILIAGATGNIGGGAAVALAQRGANVVLLGRKAQTLKARADSIRAVLSQAPIAGGAGDVTTLVVDFSDMESVRLAAAEALERFSAIHGLVVSADVLSQGGPKVLPSGHELMFATNVMGPFLLTQLLVERLKQSDGLVLQVVAPAYEELDWEDLESIQKHGTTTAYNRTKTCGRALAGELARRYAGTISSVAFNPVFIIDKSDSGMRERWPSGLRGLSWRMAAALFARPPAVAGEPIADLMLLSPDRNAINGALFRLAKRVEKPDRAMNDKELGARLWDELVRRTGL